MLILDEKYVYSTPTWDFWSSDRYSFWEKVLDILFIPEGLNEEKVERHEKNKRIPRILINLMKH